jgi:catechol 2,3-dioxygenase-like lactoylglutathione lyase family enzyme|tara:strand:+ start:274 stop:678 length:405 start_codon:yes stop_codon:yes gene_type:complete
MIGYVMVGTNDLTKATKFYDTILVPLGLLQAERTAIYTAYAPNGSKDAVEFYVTIPFDQKFATHGNGTMIALSAPTMLALKQFHRLGLSSGGTDEGAPGLREEGSDVSYAYIRDLDGNKICAFYSGAEKLSAHE